MQIPTFDPRPDIRLIACDMDGTLLDDEDEVHDDFWPLIDELHERGILFCPATGRQYYNLRERFAASPTRSCSSPRTAPTWCAGPRAELRLPGARRARAMVATVREINDAASTSAPSCAARRRPTSSARTQPFRDEVDKYYPRLQVVDDLSTVTDDDVLKVAIYDFVSSEQVSAPASPGSTRRTRWSCPASTGWTSPAWPRTRARRSATSRRRSASPRPDDGVRRLPQRPGDDGRADVLVRDGERAPTATRARPLLLRRPNSENGVVRTISSVLGLPWLD